MMPKVAIEVVITFIVVLIAVVSVIEAFIASEVALVAVVLNLFFFIVWGRR